MEHSEIPAPFVGIYPPKFTLVTLSEVEGSIIIIATKWPPPNYHSSIINAVGHAVHNHLKDSPPLSAVEWVQSLLLNDSAWADCL